jgi:hypothetical protein
MNQRKSGAVWLEGDINVMAGSLDGAIASHPNESDDERKAMGFINEADHDHVREPSRQQCDAVIAGGHSVNVSGGVMEVVNDARTFIRLG